MKTFAHVAGGNGQELTAIHEVALDNDHAVVTEQWVNPEGKVVQSYRVVLSFATLVHLALNTRAEERAAIEARIDWRGHDEQVSP